ncbi:hypothetical protein [Sphingomonas sp. Root710]|uniref:hypothetical protein n=1 Tax=Sphingomonas sp. Root710 TaxID=1736594 RepID=UPI00138F689B|nr:hypothetical protein [Sphingomonas sp. Root710]
MVRGVAFKAADHPSPQLILARSHMRSPGRIRGSRAEGYTGKTISAKIYLLPSL